MILDSKKIDYDKVDIAGNEDAKQKMREIMGNPTGLPPQLTKGDTHLGVSFIIIYLQMNDCEIIFATDTMFCSI